MIDNIPLIIKKTIEKKSISDFKKVLPTVNITLENVTFDPKGKEYVLLSCGPDLTQRLSIGYPSIVKRTAGVAYFVIYTPIASNNKNQTTDRAYELGGVISNVLEDKTFSDVDDKVKIMCLDATYGKLGFRDEYFVASVSIPYRAEYIKC
ncbi:MAG: hypothetical protein RSD40_03240 [Bacilli bacterium]